MEKTIRILILEDMPADAELAERELRKAGLNFVCRRVDTRESFRSELAEFAPHLILADYSLPSFGGGEALSIALNEAKGIPLIFLTGALGEERAVELLRAGATDYILKDNISRLPPAVRRAVAEVHEREQRAFVESALRQSEERYRLLAQNISDVAYSLDDIGNIRYIGPQIARYGLVVEKIIGRPFLEIISEESRKNVAMILDRMMETGIELPMEFKLAGADLWFENRGRPMRDERGRIIGITGILRDSTQRRKAEAEVRRLNENLETRVLERTAELEKSNAALLNEIEERIRAEEERERLLRSVERSRETAEQLALLAQRHADELESVFDCMLEPLIIYDSDGVVMKTNNNVAKVLGFDPVGAPWSEVIPRISICLPSGRPAEPHELPSRRALSGERVNAQELLLTNPLGQFFWIRVTAAPLVQQNQIIGAVSLWHDVTAEKHLMKQLETDIEHRKVLEAALRRSHDELEGRVQERTAELLHANKELGESHELLERMFSNIHILVAYLDRDFNFLRVNDAYAAADGRSPEFFVGKNHFNLYPHEGNEKLFRHVIKTGKPIFVAEKPFTYPMSPEKGISYWDWSVQPVHGARGKVVGLILSLLNVTERKNAQLALAESERRFRAIFDQSFESIALLSPNGKILEANQTLVDLCGMSADSLRGRQFISARWWRRSPTERKRLKEALQRAAIGHTVRHETEMRAADGQIIRVDFSLLPLLDENKRVHLLIAEARDITEHRRLEQRIMEIAAEERAEVGRDLHDSLGQVLTGVSFLSRVLSQSLEARGAAESKDAARIAELLGQAVSQTRALARGLCPVELSEDGLVTALEQLASNVQNIFGISCVARCNGNVVVPDAATAANLYYIAQEAVNNAVRHSQAKRMTIRLNAEPNQIKLIIRDNGVGLPEDTSAREGIGLSVMRQRATAIGAMLHVRSIRNGGTQITCVLPRRGDQEGWEA